MLPSSRTASTINRYRSNMRLELQSDSHHSIGTYRALLRVTPWLKF
jgi:hypothetical protein